MTSAITATIVATVEFGRGGVFYELSAAAPATAAHLIMLP
jgi:hypothetical protein